LAEQRVIDRHQTTLTYSSTGLSIKVHLWVLQISEAAGKENGQQKILSQRIVANRY
jgi:hypothetical protein